MTSTKLIAGVLGLQLVIIVIIFVVLLKVLNRHLAESALRQLELLFSKEIDPKIQEIIVVIPKDLSAKARERIEQAAFQKFSRNVSLVIQNDPRIKGGMIIKLNDFTIDCSLASRLKDSGFTGLFFTKDN